MTEEKTGAKSVLSVLIAGGAGFKP